MKIATAVDLIKPPHALSDISQSWADLGCGSGTFTYALAHLLEAGSRIYAVDQDSRSLSSLSPSYLGIDIYPLTLDFMSRHDEIGELGLDGILMANSLHYVKDKADFIQNVEISLKKKPQFLIVEYDTTAANAWVPYPIPSPRLEQLFSESGYRTIEKLGEIPSLYRNKIYATLIKP